MSNMTIAQVFQVEGKIFNSKAEAMAYIRRPKIVAALTAIVAGNTALMNWLLENQEAVLNAFDTGTIRRVTKTEAKQLKTALEAIVANGDKSFDFVIKNADAIADSFRWPTVKRLSDEEKAVAISNSLLAIEGADDKVVQWCISKKDALLEAYKAGIEKREVTQKATDALYKYRLGKAVTKVKQRMENIDADIANETDAAELESLVSVKSWFEAPHTMEEALDFFETKIEAEAYIELMQNGADLDNADAADIPDEADLEETEEAAE